MLSFLIFVSQLWAGADCVDCSLPPQPSTYTPPASITYVENKNCRPIEVGQGRLNQKRAVVSPDSIPADRRYLLYRKSEKQFEVIYQLNFQPKSGADAPVSMTGADMAERVRNCLAIIPPTRLPDGREMSFRFITPQEKNTIIGKAPPEILINVVKASRGNADHFAEDFRCGQIIHELLHQAGLCDEYHETGGALNVGKCRPQAQGTSVMGNGMNQALDDAAGEPFSCNLTERPDHLAYLQDPNSTHKTQLLRRSFIDVGNRPWDAFGHDQLRSDRPKDVCCKVKTASKWLDSLPDNSQPRVTLSKNDPTQLTFTNRAAFFVTSHTDITKKDLKFDETEYDCNLDDVDAALRPACVEFFELVRPELESVADPNRTMYACPIDLSREPYRFDIEPGHFELSGTRLHLRNKGNGRPLLHSGHFERLLAGECSTPATAVYDRCSRFAYEHNYTNAQKAMSCVELLPPECKSIDWIGTISQ